MNDDIRFMDELFRIITGALRLDIAKVRNYSEYLAEKLEKSGDVAVARRLRKLLEETDHGLHPAAISGVQSIPVDTESRFQLVEKDNIDSATIPPLVLSQSNWRLLREFLSVSKSRAQIEAAGVTSSLNVLLYGPPGCGKSRLARFIATELGLPLYVVRLDGVISSFLGNTSKNIRSVFEFASRTPGVLFLDEFDAIAKLRGDEQEHGELKRVVNSFIQNLDTLGSQTTLIAATNHDELLDRAIWRRFSYRFELSFPTPDERLQLWTGSIGIPSFSARELSILTDLSEGFSGSDIHEACLRLRRILIASRECPTLADAFDSLKNFSEGNQGAQRFLTDFATKSKQEIAAQLRKRNSKLYSHATISSLLGVSKATAFRLTKGKGKGHVRK